MAKISIASRRKMRQIFPKSSTNIVMMPEPSQNLQAETDADFESANEEFVKLFSKLNQALSQQGPISITLIRTDENTVKINLSPQPNEYGEEVLTSDEVCDMLKIKKKVLYKYAKMGIIPGLKIGREWRFKADSIFKLFGKGMVEIT